MSVEIARLRAFRDLEPAVLAYEHAAHLAERTGRKVAPSQLSKFERAGDPLPHGLTFADWRDALMDLKRQRGATEAQIAPWVTEAAA